MFGMAKIQKHRLIGLNFREVEKTMQILRPEKIKSPKCAKKRPKWAKKWSKTELNAIFRHVVFASF